MGHYRISKEESGRLDILKAIAMVFVVFIHSFSVGMDFADGSGALDLPRWLYLVELGVSQIIARCGVPLYFLISAVLLFKSQRAYLPTIGKKAKSLLIPYLIWNTVWIGVFILLQSLPFTAPFFSGKSTPILQGSVWDWLGLYGIGARPMDYPLWFMRDLMVVMLCYPLIGWVAQKAPKILLAVSVAVVFVPVEFPFQDALGWFSLGACLVVLDCHLTALDNIPLWKILPVYLAGFVGILFTYEWYSRTVFIFLGIVFWVRLSKNIYHCQRLRGWFLAFSKWTFMVYVLHELTLSCVKKVCLRFLPTTPVFLLGEYLLLPVAVIAGCVAVGFVFEKILPKVYRVATGGR